MVLLSLIPASFASVMRRQVLNADKLKEAIMIRRNMRTKGTSFYFYINQKGLAKLFGLTIVTPMKGNNLPICLPRDLSLKCPTSTSVNGLRLKKEQQALAVVAQFGSFKNLCDAMDAHLRSLGYHGGLIDVIINGKTNWHKLAKSSTRSARAGEKRKRSTRRK
jgi:hypothetical protein